MRQYETFELCLKGEEPKGSKAIVDVTAVFETEGISKTVRGFYAGDGIYAVRFYPQSPGMYRYHVTGAVQARGEEYCEAAKEGFHGMVRAKGTHFCFEDGTWFYPFGTTVYALSHQEDALTEKTFATLSENPFNKLRMMVFPKHTEYNHNEPPKTSVRGKDAARVRLEAVGESLQDTSFRPSDFAFEKTDGKWDVNRPCLAFWDKLEADIKRLGDLGIQCDLILLHPYDRWGFGKLSQEEVCTYLDYLTRRLCAFPNIWWSLANEYDATNYEMKDWDVFAQFVHDHDPYGHLLSNHMMLIAWDFSNPNASHICLQTKEVDQVTSWIQKYNKPLMIDETGYEGNIPFNWGNLSAFEEVDHFWTTLVQGGYCTHGETFWNEEEILWWGKGGALIGKSPKRIAFLKEIIESLPGPITSNTHAITKEQFEGMRQNLPKEMTENNPVLKIMMKCEWEQARHLILDNQEISGQVGDAAFLKYYGRKCTCMDRMDLPEEGCYDVEVIDVWEMTREKILTDVKGTVDLKLPGKEGIAVLATKKKSSR